MVHLFCESLATKFSRTQIPRNIHNVDDHKMLKTLQDAPRKGVSVFKPQVTHG